MSNLQIQIDYWKKSAKHDLSAMDNLFISKNYDWSLFIGHLVIEKILKARWVVDNNKPFPPRTHNLDKLARETNLEFDGKTLIWLVQANDFNLESRYPDYRMEFYKRAKKEFSKKHISKIKEVYQWVLKSM